jgi:hypothetical protein
MMGAYQSLPQEQRTALPSGLPAHLGLHQLLSSTAPSSLPAATLMTAWPSMPSSGPLVLTPEGLRSVCDVRESPAMCSASPQAIPEQQNVKSISGSGPCSTAAGCTRSGSPNQKTPSDSLETQTNVCEEGTLHPQTKDAARSTDLQRGAPEDTSGGLSAEEFASSWYPQQHDPQPQQPLAQRLQTLGAIEQLQAAHPGVACSVAHDCLLLQCKAGDELLDTRQHLQVLKRLPPSKFSSRKA